MSEYVATTGLRWQERLVPEHGKTELVLQQKWTEVRAFLDTTPAQTEWRDVPVEKLK